MAKQTKEDLLNKIITINLKIMVDSSEIMIKLQKTSVMRIINIKDLNK